MLSVNSNSVPAAVQKLGLDSGPSLIISIRIYTKRNDRTSLYERCVLIANLLRRSTFEFMRKECLNFVQPTIFSNNLDRKLVISRFSQSVTKYNMAHDQQENVQKLAKPTSSTKDSQEKEI